MAEKPQQVKRKPGEVLSYLREKNPWMKTIPDSQLIPYLTENAPEWAVHFQRPQPQTPSGVSVAAGNVNRAMNAWKQPFRGALQNLQAGNTAAGTMDAIVGTAQLPFAPIQVAAEGYRNLPSVIPVALGGDVPGSQTKGNILAAPFDAAAMIPSAGAGIARGLADILNWVGPSDETIAGATGVPQEKIEATGKSLGALNETVGAFLAPTAIPGVARGVGRRAEASQIKHQAKTGAVVGAGESLPDMRRAGSFAAQFNIKRPGKLNTKGGEVVPVGAEQAQAVVREYHKALNDKIIEPATKAGKTIDGNLILKGLDEMKSEYLRSVSPDRAALAAIDRAREAAKERLKASDGVLTPKQAQELKVLGNKYLEQFYKKVERRGGSLTPLEQVKHQTLANQVATLREQLEAIDPQVKQLNWASGAGLELAAAMESFAKAKLKQDPSLTRGSGMTAAASGRGYGMGLFAITELALFRPFRYAYHKAMGKAMGKIAGTPPEFAPADKVRTPTEWTYDEATGKLRKK